MRSGYRHPPQVSLTRARELHVARRSVKEARAERALELGDGDQSMVPPFRSEVFTRWKR